MKIAVISDIHGNLEALNAVLRDIEEQKADKIFVCGDLAMAGPEPEKTADKIIELSKQKNVAVILGNTDEMIIKAYKKSGNDYIPPDETMAASLKYTQQVLRSDQIDFLKNLPVKYKEKIGDYEILLVHGSPRKINENISPNLDEKTLKEMLAGTQEDIIFCGHTHLPVVYNVDNRTIVNVGSVGRPFTENPDACYAVLELFDSNKNFNVFYRFVKYEKETTAKKLKKLDFKGSEKLAEVILDPEKRKFLFK